MRKKAIVMGITGFVATTLLATGAAAQNGVKEQNNPGASYNIPEAGVLVEYSTPIMIEQMENKLVVEDETYPKVEVIQPSNVVTEDMNDPTNCMTEEDALWLEQSRNQVVIEPTQPVVMPTQPEDPIYVEPTDVVCMQTDNNSPYEIYPDPSPCIEFKQDSNQVIYE